MTDPKMRSSFLPVLLIVAGLLVCGIMVLALVPLVECIGCSGLGYLTEQDRAALDDDNPRESVSDSHSKGDSLSWECEYCTASGKITAIQRWEMGEGVPTSFVTFMSGEDIEQIKRNRRATP